MSNPPQFRVTSTPKYQPADPSSIVFFCVQRRVAGGEGVVRLALEDGEVLRLGRDQRD
jgi:hypothetical protein